MVSTHLASFIDRDTGACSLDYRIVDAHGRVKWVNHYCLPVFAEDGTYLGRRASNRDISERKANEEKLKKSEQRFRQIFDNIGAGVAICDSPDDGESFVVKESFGVLAGGIAHDFNNILFPITGLSELLMEDLPVGGAEHESATEIIHAARRAGELIKQILSFSRRSEPKRVPTRIQQMIQEIVKPVCSMIPANIDIAYDIQDDCGPVVADPTQLHQVVMNLITNADCTVRDDSHGTPGPR